MREATELKLIPTPEIYCQECDGITYFVHIHPFNLSLEVRQCEKCGASYICSRINTEVDLEH
tara:strand:- start:2009 stop:2194 length:186 start_codon:yes stop_codon:yes gene_type:complete